MQFNRLSETGCPGSADGAAEPEPPGGIRDAAASAMEREDQPALAAAPDLTETAFGGVFYLINLGLYLGLYGDFTTPEERGLALSPWDFVALLGRALAGPAIEADPVWPLLARLAGRTAGQPPGDGFDPPDQWRLPGTWLTEMGETDGGDPEPWIWNVTEGRLRVVHPAGFPVLDIPADADPDDQVWREVPWPDATLLRGPLPPSPAFRTPIDRWLGWFVPYAQARLRHALGNPAPGTEADRLCRHRARVLVAGDCVDIVLVLAELPIEIRLAGLDRDPGWVPAAGRFIAFHFE